MRVIFAPGEHARGAEMIRIVGHCRACNQKNVAWIVRGHLITMALLGCEFCGSTDGAVAGKKKVSAGQSGIQWNQGTDCWSGKVMCQNYPEQARPGDLVI